MNKSPFNMPDKQFAFPENSEGRTYRACRRCGFNRFFEEALEVVNETTVTEFKIKCTVCETVHLHWVSGAYEPYVGLETYEDEDKFTEELRKSFKASSGTITSTLQNNFSEEELLYRFFAAPKYKKVYNCSCGAHHTEFPNVHLPTCDAYNNA